MLLAFFAFIVGGCAGQPDELGAALQQIHQGDYAGAETLLLRLLAGAPGQVSEEAYPDAVTSLCHASIELAKWRQARKYCELSKAVVEKKYGREHAFFAATLCSVAIFYLAQGKYSHAEKDCRLALDIMERTRPDASAVVRAINNLGHILYRRSRYAEAGAALERALAFEVNGAERATTLQALAMVRFRQGRDVDALRLYEQSLALREAVLGKDHTSLIGVLIDLSSRYREQGQRTRAKELLLRALDIAVAKLGPENYATAGVLLRYARLLREEGAKAEAKRMKVQAEAILENDARARGVFGLVDVSDFERKGGR